MEAGKAKKLILSALQRFVAAENFAKIELSQLRDIPLLRLKQINLPFNGWTPKERQALKQHWFGTQSPDLWWPELQPLEPIVRWGLIKAIRKVREKKQPRPVQLLWTNVGERFEVSIFWNKYEVTVFIQSPLLQPPLTKGKPWTISSTLTDPFDRRNPEKPVRLNIPADDTVVVIKRIAPPVQPSPNVEILQEEANGNFIVAERLKTEEW